MKYNDEYFKKNVIRISKFKYKKQTNRMKESKGIQTYAEKI